MKRGPWVEGADTAQGRLKGMKEECTSEVRTQKRQGLENGRWRRLRTAMKAKRGSVKGYNQTQIDTVCWKLKSAKVKGWIVVVSALFDVSVVVVGWCCCCCCCRYAIFVFVDVFITFVIMSFPLTHIDFREKSSFLLRLFSLRRCISKRPWEVASVRPSV